MTADAICFSAAYQCDLKVQNISLKLNQMSLNLDQILLRLIKISLKINTFKHQINSHVYRIRQFQCWTILDYRKCKLFYCINFIYTFLNFCWKNRIAPNVKYDFPCEIYVVYLLKYSLSYLTFQMYISPYQYVHIYIFVQMNLGYLNK